MTTKTQKEYLVILKGIVDKTGDLDNYNRLMFDWVKSGVITRTTYMEASTYLQTTLLHYS